MPHSSPQRFSKKWIFFALLAIAGVVLWKFPIGYFVPLSSHYYLKRDVQGREGFDKRPALPNLSGFTEENMLKKMPALEPGNVVIDDMEGAAPLRKFSFDKRLVEAREIQGRVEPQAIHIYSGVYDIHSLMQAVKDSGYIVERDEGYIVRLPIAVYPDATLILKDLDKPVLLSQSKGGFIVTAGSLFIIHSEVRGWNEKLGKPAELAKTLDNFRPFITTWDGSEIYISRSKLDHLGYALSKSYGISLSSNDVVQEEFEEEFGDLAPPTGWIIDSEFSHMYFGFYSYEAEDVVINRNTYFDNQIYGIDPHDRSRRLIIANNHVWGSHKKHGIIISREVNDSFIFGNLTEKNKGSGIMLDRMCENTVVANNHSRYNHGDGITLYESPNNWLVDNMIERNEGSGIRIRNSWGVFVEGGKVQMNKAFAFELYEDPLENTGRDFEMDPVTLDAEASFRDIALGSNGGILKISDMRRAHFEGIDFSKASLKRTPFAGDIAPASKKLLRAVGEGQEVFDLTAWTHSRKVIGGEHTEESVTGGRGGCAFDAPEDDC